MKSVFAAFVAIASLLMVSACSHSGAPPSGRWEGAYDSPDTIVAARLEITLKGDIYLSAPDAVDVGSASGEDRAAIRQRLADGLGDSWSSVQPRKLDFDGTTFRKPDGIAPQIEWNSAHNTMTLMVYLGTQPALHIALRPVKNFSANPFAGF